MSVITLTSDFGLVDYRVASIKGSILALKPDIQIVDISHQITPYNLLQTAYIVANAYKHFPKGTVHIISVESSYRKEVRHLLHKVDGHYFLSSDNGIISLIFPEIKPESIHEITVNNRFDDEINSVTIDVFVPAAVHLTNGGLPDVIGRVVDNPLQKSTPRAVDKGDMIIGEVIYIDNFGNVICNISQNLFSQKQYLYDLYKIKFRNLSLSNIYDKLTDVVKDWNAESEYHGKSVAIFNEAGWLQLGIYKGSSHNGASRLFGLSIGEKVYIQFDNQPDKAE